MNHAFQHFINTKIIFIIICFGISSLHIFCAFRLNQCFCQPNITIKTRMWSYKHIHVVFFSRFLCWSVVSGSWSELLSLVWRTAPPAVCVRPRSWLWSACTSCTCLEEAGLRSSSRATGGRGRAMEHGSPSAYCGGISCTGARPLTPNLLCYGQIRL